MSSTIIHKVFRPLKRALPDWLSNFIRSSFTALFGPLRFAVLSGFVRSAFKMSAVARDGSPLPWYTYPIIDFLKFRDHSSKTVLEFGGGQSSLWWAARASSVTTLEGDLEWYQLIRDDMPANVDLHSVTMESRQANVLAVNAVLDQKELQLFDIIIIDGLYREQMVEIALQHRASNGVIICDNAEGYGFAQLLKNAGLKRVDFFGNAPGVVLAACSSIYFSDDCYLFSADYDIPVISNHH